MDRTTGRNSNLEMLRIISMIMIIALHYLNNGEILNTLTLTDKNYHLCWILESVSYCSVNCFVLISGYFLSNQNSIKYKKIIEILAEVLFYSIVMYLGFCIIGVETFNIKSLIVGYLFPITHGQWWYATVYVVLIVCIPYLNIIANNLNQRSYQKVLLVFGVIFSVIPSVLFFYVDRIGLEDGYSLIWFVYLFFWGGYIKRFKIHLNRGILFFFFSVFSLSTYLVKVLQQLCGFEYWNLYHYNSFTVLGSALCLFLLFLKSRQCSNRIINTIASTTFGIFLFHTHFIMREKVLWNLVSPVVYARASTEKFILHFIISIAVVFSIGVMTDLCRQRIFSWSKRFLLRIKKEIHNIS